MSKYSLGIFCSVIAIGLAVAMGFQHRENTRLHRENEGLRQDLGQVARLEMDNRRLSNTLTQATAAQANAKQQFQELLRLRSEINRLEQDKQDSNRVDQAALLEGMNEQLRELAALRTDLSGLRDEIGDLREDIRQMPEPAAGAAQTEERPAEQGNRTRDQRQLTIRMIDTHLDSFPDKLKRSVAAQDSESFQEVFSRFLQANGVDVTTVAGLAFDERTGRIIVRAPQGTLDVIERLTTNLDRSQ